MKAKIIRTLHSGQQRAQLLLVGELPAAPPKSGAIFSIEDEDFEISLVTYKLNEPAITVELRSEWTIPTGMSHKIEKLCEEGWTLEKVEQVS